MLAVTARILSNNPLNSISIRHSLGEFCVLPGKVGGHARRALSCPAPPRRCLAILAPRGPGIMSSWESKLGAIRGINPSGLGLRGSIASVSCPWSRTFPQSGTTRKHPSGNASAWSACSSRMSTSSSATRSQPTCASAAAPPPPSLCLSRSTHGRNGSRRRGRDSKAPREGRGAVPSRSAEHGCPLQPLAESHVGSSRLCGVCAWRLWRGPGPGFGGEVPGQSAPVGVSCRFRKRREACETAL